MPIFGSTGRGAGGGTCRAGGRESPGWTAAPRVALGLVAAPGMGLGVHAIQRRKMSSKRIRDTLFRGSGSLAREYTPRMVVVQPSRLLAMKRGWDACTTWFSTVQ